MKKVMSSDWLVSENKAGAKKFWQLHIVKDGDRYYTQTSWYQITGTGKESTMQESAPYYAAPTNVGRANERNSEQQAEFEFESVIKKQKDKGYRSKGEKKQVRPLPMLAHKFKDHPKKVAWPAFVQPKLDGMRMLCDGKTGWSRGNKEIIPQVIKHILFDTKGHILDGELILPGNGPLQETMKASKKFRPGLSDTLEYHIYDIVDETMTYRERMKVLVQLHKTAPQSIKLVPSTPATTEAELLELHANLVKQGYEGTIIRNPEMKYEIGKRSYSLLKLKDWFDEEFKIVEVMEGSGVSVGMAIFKCINENGDTFDSTPEATHAQRQEWFKDRKSLIGKWATVKHYGYTNDGLPVFNNTIAIREKGEF